MADKETLDVYAKRAGDYAKRFTKSSADKYLSAFMAALPEGARVLDLGCGPGQSTALMAQNGFDAEGWDASPEMAQTAKELHNIDVRVATFEALTATNTYDGIYANFSLLHAPKSDMPGHLARIATALKPGGLFHIGTKSGTGERRDSIGRFYAFYTDPELTDLLHAAGLSPIDHSFGEEVGLDGATAPWIIILARKPK